MNVFRKVINMLNNMGIEYFVYRGKHEFEKKTGILKKKHPPFLSFQRKISLHAWQQRNEIFSTPITEKNISISEDAKQKLKIKGQNILNGRFLFFNAEWVELNKNYNWVTNPSNGYTYDITKHWSEIPDLSQEAGDIKYVWEKSRFSWLLTLIRYDFHFKEDLSEFVFAEIDSWINYNPINMGPNWRCSQEISLRMFNWFFALSYYKNSAALTDERWAKIQDIIYASLHHVYNNINFSRIAVRNNHAITETLFLALSEILFPFIAETEDWARKGRKWFEEEVAYQVYEDGTFLQFSMNYHRVVIQLLTLGISITEKVGKPFSRIVYNRAYKSVEFLYQCMDEKSGWLPNYGSNDGALFFPWADVDYRNYKPQINSLHFLLTGCELFDNKSIIEEIVWWDLKPSSNLLFQPLRKHEGIKEYSIGGYVIIRDKKTFTFIRCGSHKDRPAQADNMHVDIWVNGENVLRDSGTYKYNTSPELMNYFMGTVGHNTVMVDGQSQMQKGSRFIWYYWSQKIKSTLSEDKCHFVFSGTIKAYSFLNKNAKHSREVIKIKGEPKWIIRDSVLELDDYTKEQVWHVDNNKVSFSAKEDDLLIKPSVKISYNSKYYGVMEEGKGVGFTFKKRVETELIVK